jgi:hypothetical protein
MIRKCDFACRHALGKHLTLDGGAIDRFKSSLSRSGSFGSLSEPQHSIHRSFNFPTASNTTATFSQKKGFRISGLRESCCRESLPPRSSETRNAEMALMVVSPWPNPVPCDHLPRDHSLPPKACRFATSGLPTPSVLILSSGWPKYRSPKS